VSAKGNSLATEEPCQLAGVPLFLANEGLGGREVERVSGAPGVAARRSDQMPSLGALPELEFLDRCGERLPLLGTQSSRSVPREFVVHRGVGDEERQPGRRSGNAVLARMKRGRGHE